jgi:hypothetical protein
MVSESWSCNRGYDQRAAFETAVQDLLKLDAQGCRIVKEIAQAMVDYGNCIRSIRRSKRTSVG